ncbi:MAG: hypothetical protein ACFFCI_10940 [Promethearchaeota archaeon]
MKDVNELQKWNYAHQISQTFNPQVIINRLEKVSHSQFVKIARKKVSEPLTQQAAIIDFEGNPVFLIGILIYDTLFSYYIEDYEHKVDLYLTLLKILLIMNEIVFFAFSTHEKEEIQKICRYLEVQEVNLTEYACIYEIPIINLQKGRYESMLEALYSICPTMKITGDALFRNNRLVDQLFYAHKYEEIVTHNQHCLINEAIILSKRWLKLHTI